MGSKQEPERGLRACEVEGIHVRPKQATEVTASPNEEDWFKKTARRIDFSQRDLYEGAASPDLFASSASELESPLKESVHLKLDLPEVCSIIKFAHYRCTTAKSVLSTTERTPLETLIAGDKKDMKTDEKSEAAKKGSKKRVVKADLTSSFVSKHLEMRNSSTVRSRPKLKFAPASKFIDVLEWTRSYVILDDAKKQEVIEDLQSPGAKNVAKEVADMLCLQPEVLMKFQLFHQLKFSSVVKSLYHLVSHFVYPDVMKMLAFSEWQNDKGSLKQCAYYLAESHGTYLKSDIVDKHCLFFCKKEESAQGQQVNETEEVQKNERLRKKVFVRQIRDALSLGRKCDDFTIGLNEINPNWNVIQLSAMSFGCNRFGSDIVKHRTTPPMFLTSFLHVPGDQTRSSLVRYVRQPQPTFDCLPHGILEEFKIVMIKNRHINEAYSGTKAKYWDIRAEHNKHLSAIIESLEEHWLMPYAVLFPGNIKDKGVQSTLTETLVEIQDTAGKKLSSPERVFLYKLMENLHFVSPKILQGLTTIIKSFLEISTRRADIISTIIQNVAPRNSTLERWQTILILDMELEQLPWDWLPCLRTTSVTRMSSVNAICSALNIMSISRPKFPGIVDISKCTYIVNPDLSLGNVQKRLEGFFKSHSTWDGIIARKPSYEEMENALQNNDVIIYCGHGSGINYFPEFALQRLLCKAVPILMGCSSGQYRYNGPKANSYSVVSSYLIAACPSIVGYLWEVTDVECDRVTTDMIQRWLPGSKKIPTFTKFDPKQPRPREKCLATAVLKSRQAATQFLTEAALVNYGLPIDTM